MCFMNSLNAQNGLYGSRLLNNHFNTDFENAWGINIHIDLIFFAFGSYHVWMDNMLKDLI